MLTPEEYSRVIGLVGGLFRDLLAMAWESGIRPQEIRVVEARHLDLENDRIVFPVKESKGKKLPQVVYLTDDALEIARRMAAEHPVGPIFRNSDGAPWTRYAINCAFIRLRIAFGRQVMKDKGISGRSGRSHLESIAFGMPDRSEIVRGDKTPLERFIASVRRLPATIRALLILQR